jgi:tetratricopeptide (TPR) repeat protein
VLTRWGGALLELAHFKQGKEAVEMIELAIAKFQAALDIEPKKHDALWCLGNALTSQGFLFQEAQKACSHFDEAKTCFQRALNEEPTNEIYRKALEMTDKAPGLHAELQRQLAEQQIYHEASKNVQKSTKGVVLDDRKVTADFWYGVGGWLCFMGVAFSWTLLLARQKAF